MKTIVACLLLSLTGYCSAVAICTLEYSPRCGVDGKIYSNLCFLRSANVEEADSFEVCRQQYQTACLAIYLPVCGQDGKVYSNDCVMRVAGVEQAESFEACRGHPELCPEVCTMEYVPVCGSDGKIYGNKCEMKARNCGKLMFTRPMSECEAQSAPVGPKCPKIYFPTCGVDGKVYDNDCLRSFAEVEEAESFETCRSANHPLCPAICTMEYAPVCGSDGNIYATECVMRSQNCGKRLYVKAMEECQ